MAEVELIMPKMGESIMEATVLKWLKQEGDRVEEDEPVLEIATDKVDSEVPSPADGKMGKLLCQEGDTIKVGEPIATIRTEGEEAPTDDSAGEAAKSTEEKTATPSSEQAASPVSEKPRSPEPAAATASTPVAAPSKDGDRSRFYSPLVMNIARKENVSMRELEQIEGTGMEGRVTKKDMLQYIRDGKPAQATAQATEPAQQAASKPEPEVSEAAEPPPGTSYEGQNVEIIEMDRMRKMIAEHMVRSKHTSPHVTSFVEADVTKLVNWRNKVKKSFQEREGGKITFTPLFIEAVVKALKDFPRVNVSVDGDKIIMKKDINIGMAAALPNGNLIVPVIRNADHKNLIGLAKEVNDLAARARDNKLKPQELEGGTFTLTNVGTFGNVMGTPIINQPQVAILATGAIQKKPVVIETEEGDMIGIRHMMYLSHAYDHRVVDGALGGAFVRRVADYLEAFDAERTL